MKYVIISDIHANMEALEAVLAAIEKKEKPDRMACLGDLVGYGPQPNEVVEWAIGEQKKGMVFVKGNHDKDISDVVFRDPGYTPIARIAIDMQRKWVKEENKVWLRELPFHAKADNLQFVHGSPRQWDAYIFDYNDIQDALKLVDEACFIGHTHEPHIYSDPPKVLVNVGSVGQPRDGNRDAAYCTYDTVSGKAEIKRVKYNILGVQKKMRDLNIPHRLIERLGSGE